MREQKTENIKKRTNQSWKEKKQGSEEAGIERMVWIPIYNYLYQKFI
jgi:hypothetical protein